MRSKEVELAARSRAVSKVELYDRQLARATLPEQTRRFLVAHHEVSRLMRRRTLAQDRCCVLATFGLLVAYLEIYLIEDSATHREDATSSLLKSVVSLSTALLLAQLVAAYQLDVSIRVRQYRLPPASSLWTSWPLLRQLALEAAVLAFHIPPGVDFVLRVGVHDYHADSLAMLMFVRAYLLTVVVRNHSGYADVRMLAMQDTGTAVDPESVAFHLKVMFADAPARLLWPLTALLVVVSSFCLHVAERDANPDLVQFRDAAWVTVVTMATVGYGDVAPVTLLGRLVTVVGGVVGGAVVLALVTTVLISLTDLNRGELTVLSTVQHARDDAAARVWGATVVQRAWRVSRAPPGSPARQPLRDALYEAMNEARDLRLAMVAHGASAHDKAMLALRNVDARVRRMEEDGAARMEAMQRMVERMAEQVDRLSARPGLLEERVMVPMA